jgi:hypothetical protein
MQLQNLQGFINDVADSNFYIMRFKDSVINKEISIISKQLLNRKIPFDHLFDINDTSTLYCAELPYYCFHKLNKSEFFIFRHVKNNPLIKFDSFFRKKYFEQIFASRKIYWFK